MKEVQELKYTSLEGLSEKQLKEHHDVLYAGYVNKWNQIRKDLVDADKSLANATYSTFRELKNEQSFAGNAIKLHEAYFNNLGGDGQAKNEILELIVDDFGSFEDWKTDYYASGISARGWVVLSYDLDDNRLYNFTCDAHNQGDFWNNIVLLVLDVYEHAYMIDYGTNRKDYLDTFFNNIDWDYVNGIVKKWDLKEMMTRARAA